MNICRVQSITTLGVVLNDNMNATYHISSLLTLYSSFVHGLRVLRDHVLPANSLQDVLRNRRCENYLPCSSVDWPMLDTRSYTT